MNANPIQMDPSITYPEKWTPMEFVCKCGVKVRIDVEVIVGLKQGGVLFHHCGKDEGQYLPGRIIANWEERDGSWVRNQFHAF